MLAGGDCGLLASMTRRRLMMRIGGEQRCDSLRNSCAIGVALCFHSAPAARWRMQAAPMLADPELLASFKWRAGAAPIIVMRWGGLLQCAAPCCALILESDKRVDPNICRRPGRSLAR